MNAEELLKKLDSDRDAYLATFQQVHEALARRIIASNAGISTASSARPISDRVARLSMGESDRRGVASLPSTFKTSFISGEDEDLSDEDEALYVQQLLPAISYDDEHLRTHLRTYRWNEQSEKILEPILNHEGRLSLFQAGEKAYEDGSHHSLYQVFDIGTDGAPPKLPVDSSPSKTLTGQSMWNIIKDVNADAAKRQAVGRISILREPSPTLFAAIHLTMKDVFDMDEIFSHLVEQGTTMAIMPDAFSDDKRKQNCLAFSFEYFTIIGDSCEPMSWQESDQGNERKDGHIPISRCSSVVALSFVGEPFRKIKSGARRAETRYGYVYSPWSPWHVLNIQCYPDWKSDTDSHDSTKHYVNGPDAFLNTLLIEYKDAQKRFEEISKRVTRLITPPADFMFNRDLRDKLLFEDNEFTYSRRYFWAFQTLGTMNQSIRAMVDAYEDTFTRSVWEGQHKILWPLVEESGRNTYWKKRMASLKNDFDLEIKALKELLRRNDERRKEIKSLRENLFSGTSVLESRKSVEQSEIAVQQGHNIKLLTLVNMFFLPLTFVTSVFGMTNMDPDGDFWRFGVTMATVCVPFFLLIGSMNTNRGMRFWKEQFGSIFLYLFAIFRWTKAKDWSEKSETREMTRKSRSRSASEGIARRTGYVSSEKTADSEPSSSRKKHLSSTHSPTIEEEPDPGGSQPAHSIKVEIQPNSLRKLIAPSLVQTQQPAMTTVSSSSKSNAVSESTETSESPALRAAYQKNDLGIWDRLRPSRRRNGGKDYPV